MKRFVLIDAQVRQGCADWILNEAQEGWHVVCKPPTRTLDQNAAQWPILDAFSKQLVWPVNGAMVKMSADEWKDVLTAAFKRETVRLAQGLDGGVVMLGAKTSAMSKPTFSEWLEFLNATAAQRGLMWAAPLERRG